MAVDAMTGVISYRNDMQSIQRAGQQAQRAVQRSLQGAGQITTRINATISRANIARLRRELRMGIGDIQINPMVNRAAARRARREIQQELNRLRISPGVGGVAGGAGAGVGAGIAGGALAAAAPAAAAVAAAGALTVGVGRAIVDLGLLSNRLNVVEQGYRNLASSAGVSATAFQQEVATATRGLLGYVGEIELSRDILATGITALTGDVGTFITDVADVATLRGRDIQESLARVVAGIQKQETELLDELGVKVLLDDANKRYAESLGVSASALTQEQRITAFAVETRRQLNIQAEASGRLFSEQADDIRNATTEVTNLNNEWNEFLASFGRAVEPAAGLAIAGLREVLRDAQSILEAISGRVLDRNVDREIEQLTADELERFSQFRTFSDTRTNLQRRQDARRGVTASEVFQRARADELAAIQATTDREFDNAEDFNRFINQVQARIEFNKRETAALAEQTAEKEKQAVLDAEAARRQAQLLASRMRIAELDKRRTETDRDIVELLRLIGVRRGPGVRLEFEEEFVPLTEPLPGVKEELQVVQEEIVNFDSAIQSLGETVAESAADFAVGEFSWQNFVRSVVQTVTQSALQGARDEGGGLLGFLSQLGGGGGGIVENVANKTEQVVNVSPQNVLGVRNSARASGFGGRRG